MSSSEVPVSPHARDASDVAQALGTDAERGLTSEEAARRLTQHGRNVLRASPPRPAWRRLLAQFQDPLVYLLLVAAGEALRMLAHIGLMLRDGLLRGSPRPRGEKLSAHDIDSELERRMQQ